jgi:hypothetical protein
MTRGTKHLLPFQAPLPIVLQAIAVTILAAILFSSAGGSVSLAKPLTSSTTLEQAMAASQDLWGLEAMRQTNGASYEFFARLLPPPRYVNAQFRYYPIPLSAPNAQVKARLISNGSGINSAGKARSWNDLGIPINFRVGPDEFVFGSLPNRLQEPTLAQGWLPIVEIRYKHPTPAFTDGPLPLDHAIPDLVPEVYRLEAFASCDSGLSSNGVVMVKFDLAAGANGYLAVEVENKGPIHFSDGSVLDDNGQALAVFDASWKWERKMAVTRIRPGSVATLAIPTKPLAAGAALKMSPATYAEERATCVKTWDKIVDQGMNLESPEPLVNNTWRHLIVQNFELIHGDRMHYSSGNQYDKLYEAEGTDAALGMLAWGYEKDMRRWLEPLLDFTRKNLECHQAGFKLEDVCRYFWQTRDAAAIRQLRPRWEKELRLLTDARTNDVQLCPKQQYCGDIHTLVYSVTANAKGWRAVRDMSVILGEVGDRDEARNYGEVAANFRKAVLTAIDQSVRRETVPPFVPVALYTNEPPHDPITDRRIGCYWNVVIDYVTGSGVFGPNNPAAEWIPRYQEEHGGLCMGMLRAGAAENTFWSGKSQVWPLYTTRYAIDALRRDESERALVSFYGALAQGFTRNTFISGEGCALTPLDEGGRFLYCPPNSAANSHLLSTLRQLLVQDLDADDNGTPETLRLFFGTPRRWLEDGKTIKLERAPTEFGPVSVNMQSRLARGRVFAIVDLPARNRPLHTWLRARVPSGWRVISADADSKPLKVDALGTVDLSTFQGRATINFSVERI